MNTDIIKSLYLANEGRIARKTWWLGVVGLIVAGIVVSLVLSILGLSPAWRSFITFVVLVYPYYNLSLKRRHDKDNTGLDVLVYLAITALVLLMQAFGIGTSMVDAGGGIMVPMPSMLQSVIYFALGVYAIYLLVVLGVLRGSDGANSYGPDPLGGPASAAA